MKKQNEKSGVVVEEIKFDYNSPPEEFEKQFGFNPKDVFILVCTPAYGGLVYTNYMISYFKTSKLLDKIGIRMELKTIGNESLITRARNTCVSYFLSNPKYTHLMFIDADVSWNPNSIINLLSSKKDVVGGVYPKKGYNFAKLGHILKTWDGKDLNHLKDINLKILDYAVNFDDVKNIKIENDCIKVKDVATGFMLIERSVFGVLKEKFPELRYNNDLSGLDANLYNPENFWLFFDCIKDPDDGRYLSEDYAFCRLVQMAGMSCWVNVTIPLSHTGTNTFQGNILSMFNVPKN
jgi:hypothetical protein